MKNKKTANSSAVSFQLLLLGACCTSFAFCAPTAQDYPPWDGSYAQTVYVLDITVGFHVDEVLFLQAIQGITAREKPQVYLNHFGRLGYNVWLEETQKKHKFEIVTVSGIWELAEIFKDYIKGYVTYPVWESEAMNYAATLAGVLDAVPVTPRLRAEANSRGLQQLDNAEDYEDISRIIQKYGSRLNKKKFLNHNNTFDWTLRDYGIKHRCITVYEDQAGLQPVYDFMEPNAVMFGYGRDGEIYGVRGTSEHQIIYTATNQALNMSFYEEGSTEVYKQPHEPIDKNLKAESGKHYVSFSYSDGDNIQWLINELPLDVTRWAAQRTVPLGWPLTPLLPELAPVILEYLYKTAALTDTIFSAGCGYGYIFPSLYEKDNLIEYGKMTAEAMRRSGMEYVEIYDEYFTGETSTEVFEAYLRNPQIKGILYRTGDYYAGGRGFLKWVNGKPVVSYKDALWNVNYSTTNIPENEKNKDIYQLAYRISQYDKDYTKIDGYTMVMVHAWSHLYDSIQKAADWLAENDPDVVIVTPVTLVRLIEENVPKTNAAPDRHRFSPDWDYSSVADLY